MPVAMPVPMVSSAIVTLPDSASRIQIVMPGTMFRKTEPIQPTANVHSAPRGNSQVAKTPQRAPRIKLVPRVNTKRQLELPPVTGFVLLMCARVWVERPQLEKAAHQTIHTSVNPTNATQIAPTTPRQKCATAKQDLRWLVISAFSARPDTGAYDLLQAVTDALLDMG